LTKKILFILSLLISFANSSSFGQALYGNEWIFDYSKTYYKIKVASNGIYKIPFATLQTYGIENNFGSDYLIFNKGVEVPIYVSNAGLFSSNDFIEFYGEKNDGWLDSLIYKNPSTEQLNPFYSLFNDTAIYYLVVQAGVNHSRILGTSNISLSSQSAEPWYWHTSLYEGHNSLSGGKYINLGAGNTIATSTFDNAEGYFDLFFNTTTSHSVNTANISTAFGIPNAKVSVYELGVYAGTNDIQVSLNNHAIFPFTSFNNTRLNKFVDNNVPIGFLTSPNTTFQFNMVNSTNYNGVSAIKIDYPHSFNLNNITSLKFSIDNTFTSFINKRLSIANYNAQGGFAILYDLTSKFRLTAPNPGGSVTSFDFGLPISSVSNREFYLSNSNNQQIVTNLSAVKFVDYLLPSKQANYIIVSNKELYNDGNGNNFVELYGAYRHDLAGGAYDTLIVDINTLYDQFGYGIVKHPIAIRNFAKYAFNTFTIAKPYHLFIIGKGITYTDIRNNAGAYKQCLIPTFGYPGSDALLTGFDNADNNKMSVGRLSAYSGQEVKYYLDKVQEYELKQRESCITGEQNLTNKNWMKQVVHLTGGINQFQQDQFDGYLNTGLFNPLPQPMKYYMEGVSFGGHVNSFKKSSAAPIQLSASYKLDSLINSGISILNFFGHSAFSTLEFAIDNPESYQNYGKYPFIISNGCFSGDIFTQTNGSGTNRGLSERFVIPDANGPYNIGSIGYLSSTSLGLSSGLNAYSNWLCKNISTDHYGSTIGECIRLTCDSILANGNNGYDMLTAAQQMCFHGDPALRINPHQAPDYVMESSQVNITPAQISLEQGTTFHLKFNVVNIGSAINDSINVVVTRYFPKADLTIGSSPIIVNQYRILAPPYQTTIELDIPIVETKALGQNRICILVDPADEIPEICENNNSICVDFTISSLDILPIWPYPFSIVYDTAAFALKASTVDALAPNRKYIFQIDTTELFNSSMLATKIVYQEGGVVDWNRPISQWLNNKVYYWRCAVDTLYGNHTLVWHNTSFTYINGSSPGWDQSHYYEFLKDDYTTLKLETDRVFKFADNIRSIKVKDYGSGANDDVAPFLDYSKLGNGGSCIPYGSVYGPSPVTGGFNIVVLDSATGVPFTSGNPFFRPGDYNCGGVGWLPIFQYLTKGHLIFPNSFGSSNFNAVNGATNPDSAQQAYLSDFITNHVPNGNYVLLYSINNWNPSGGLIASLKNTLHTLLGTTIVDTITTSNTHVIFARKGGFGYTTKEVAASTIGGLIDTTFYFSGYWNKGIITTPAIGPAKSWSSLNWQYFPKELPNTDSTSINLIGIDNTGNQTILYSNNINTVFSYNLSAINPINYPYLKIQLVTKDTVHRTPAQLLYWRINYVPYPEAALDKHSFYTFESDTMNRGDILKFNIAVKNTSNYNFDSIYLKYSLIKNNGLKDSFVYNLGPLNKWDTIQHRFNLSSFNYPGINTLLIDLNPFDYRHRDEQFHFNNLAKVNFNVAQDLINPLLDVTFDGVHIFDGDLVSAKPHIAINLKDENKYLPLDNKSLFTISLKKPGSNAYVPLTSSNSNLVFTAPINAAKNNTAKAELDPICDVDGTYYLKVRAVDKSNNASGDLDYEVAFEVLNESMISNLLNYPNPFTTKTQFVFTLTGSQIPTYFKIQIMTVSGKVVRELTLAELGNNLHIGKNVTEYAWDGTDNYNKPLANGLYFYRVVTNIAGEKILHYETSIDKYFKKGFGKMYLMR
jgi:hypothetical protein